MISCMLFVSFQVKFQYEYKCEYYITVQMSTLYTLQMAASRAGFMHMQHVRRHRTLHHQSDKNG